MAKIPQKLMGLLGKFADSLDYNDLPKGWADNPEIVEAAGELYREWARKARFSRRGLGTGLRQEPIMKQCPGNR